MRIKDEAAQVLAVGTWRIDPASSTASFTVGNLGKTVRGTVPVLAGTVQVGSDGRSGTAEATLDLDHLQTGSPRREKDLRGPKLLDLDSHPVMTFRAHRVQGTEFEGTLQVKGVEAAITGTVEPGEEWSADAATVRLSTSFDRRIFGVRAPRLLIGHRIDVTVLARLTREE